MTALLKLAERCEQATGPDRHIDADIYVAFGYCVITERERPGGPAWQYYGHGDLSAHYSPRSNMRRYTASLDAAMTMVPEQQIVFVANTAVEDRKADFARCSAIVGPPENTSTDYSSGATMALALCAAALRARAA